MIWLFWEAVKRRWGPSRSLSLGRREVGIEKKFLVRCHPRIKCFWENNSSVPGWKVFGVLKRFRGNVPPWTAIPITLVRITGIPPPVASNLSANSNLCKEILSLTWGKHIHARLRLICYYGLRCLNDLRVGTYSPPEFFGSVYFVSWWRKTAKYSIFSMQPWFFSACNRLCFLLLF